MSCLPPSLRATRGPRRQPRSQATWGATFRSITLRLLLGIGGGAPYNQADVRLGDVVVSMPSGTHGGVVEYDFGKQTPTGFQRKGFLCPVPKDWLRVLTLMRSDHRVQSNRTAEFVSRMLERFPALAQHYRRPSAAREEEESDLLFKPNYDLPVGSSLFKTSNVLYALWAVLLDIPQDPLLTRVYLLIDALEESSVELSSLPLRTRKETEVIEKMRQEFPPRLKPLYERMLLRMQELEEFESISELVALFGSFLIVREDRVHLIHQSAREYLRTPQASSILAQSSGQHKKIVSQSLSIMRAELENHVSGNQTIRASVEAQSNVTSNQVPLYIEYPCCYWIGHLIITPGSTAGLWEDGDINCFLKEQILHWLDAMQAMRQLSRGISMISGLAERLADLEDQQRLLTFLRDARRFLLRFRSIIETAPTQIYTSALIFSPLNSLIHKRFIHEIPPLLDSHKLPAVESDWRANMFTLEGHRQPVSIVAFSPNGDIIASGSVDGEVRTWDAATGGALLVKDNCHSEAVCAGVFGPDGAWLATGSDDGSIYVWDAATGAAMHTLREHTDRISQLVVSSTGSVVASASWDERVRLWDPATGAIVWTLVGHSESIDALAMSPNDTWLASGSQDGVIILWNALLGDAIWTVDGHSSWAHSWPSVESPFSPNSRQLATSAHDHTIRDSHRQLRALDGFSEWFEEPISLRPEDDHSRGFFPQVVLGRTRRLVIFGDQEIVYLSMERRGEVCAYKDGCFVLGHRTTGHITFLTLASEISRKLGLRTN